MHSRFASYLSILLVAGLVFPGISACQEATAELPMMMVHKSPTCGCCAKWIEHVEAAGFKVMVHDESDMGPIKLANGVDRELQSCHTATVGGYVVEGHVPADQIIRLLKEKPDVKGIAVPGMPIGSPGMEQGTTVQPYDVVTFDSTGVVEVYKRIGS